jgi:hypothetical protein
MLENSLCHAGFRGFGWVSFKGLSGELGLAPLPVSLGTCTLAACITNHAGRKSTPEKGMPSNATHEEVLSRPTPKGGVAAKSPTPSPAVRSAAAVMVVAGMCMCLRVCARARVCPVTGQSDRCSVVQTYLGFKKFEYSLACSYHPGLLQPRVFCRVLAGAQAVQVAGPLSWSCPTEFPIGCCCWLHFAGYNCQLAGVVSPPREASCMAC